MEDVEVGDGLATFARGDTIIVLWRDPATPPRWAWQWERIRRHMSTRESFVLGVVILETSSPPEAPLRARMQQDFRTLGPKLRRMVAIPIGSTLWLTLVRPIVRGILMISGLSRQHVVADSIDDGIERIRDAAGPETPSVSSLRQMVDLMRKALAEQRSHADAHPR